MNNRLLKTALAVTTALTVATPTWAQSADGADDGTIIVTARRTEENVQDVPISITVVSQDELARRNVVSTNDLGNFVPSLSSNEQFGPAKASFVIRGFTQEGKTSPSVGVYFADVVAPRSFGGTTSGNGAGVGSVFDLENIQVLKGPQGTLFGRNTTGGAILLVPAKPKDTIGGYVEGSMGSYNLKRVQAVLNIPVNDSIRVRGGLDWNERAGYVRNRSGVGPDRFNDTNYIAARLSVVIDLTPDLENYTIGSYSKSNTAGNMGTLVACTNPDPNAPPLPFLASILNPFACAQVARQQARGDGFWDVESDEPNPFQMIEQWQVINTTTWDVTDTLTIKNIISYAEFTEAASFDLFSNNYLDPATGTRVTRAINLHPGFSGKQSAQSTFTEELQFIGEAAGGRFKWQAGAYIEVSKPLKFNSGNTEIFTTCADSGNFGSPAANFGTCSPYLLFGFLPIGSVSSSNVKTTFNNKGLYAQATYDVTDRFAVTGGIRYTIDKMTDISENMNIFTLAPGVVEFRCQNQIVFLNALVTDQSECNIALRDKWKKPTWLIGAEFKPNEDLMLFAKWARGYRQGSINSNNLGLELVGPEEVDTFEVGAKKTFRGAVPGYFNITGHYNNFRDQQLAVNSVVAPAFQGRVSPAQPIVNAGKSRIWGIEVDASVRPFQGFRIDVGYAYLNTKLISITPPLVPIFFSSLLPASEVGEALALAPKNRVTVSASYTLPLDESIGEISFGATFSHTDSNRAVSPTASPNFFQLKKSDLLNLNAEWKSVGDMPLDLSVFVTNVTNEKRFTYPISGFNTIGGEGGHLNQPRMWGVRVRFWIDQ